MVYNKGLPGWHSGKESTCQLKRHETQVRCLGLGRCPRERNGNLLQYSCQENSMDRGTWWAVAHEVTKSQAQLNTNNEK